MTANNGYTYTLSRTFDVPVAKVWRAWTTPEQYAEWVNAVAGSVEMDVTVGGGWKAVMRTPHGDFPLTGSYLEVSENKHLVIGMDSPGRSEPAVMYVNLQKRGGGQTHLVLSQICDTEEERNMAEQGSTMLLDGLTAFLTTS